jgi:hypothetical protein
MKPTAISRCLSCPVFLEYEEITNQGLPDKFLNEGLQRRNNEK